MGMHVFSKLKQSLKRKDKSRDADWDFGARQSPPDAANTATRRDNSPRRRRSSSLDSQRNQPPAPHSPVPRQQQQQQLQNRRVSAAVGSDESGSRRVTPGVGPRSGSPEDDVLVAAGETAKEVRTAAKPAEQRRRVHSVAAAARLTDSPGRPTLRHASSVLNARDAASIPLPSSPSTSRHGAGSPTPSVQSFQSIQSGSSDASRRAALLASKRSMPQLHNVWENFLEEAAEDVDAFNFPMPPCDSNKFATVHVNPRTDSSQPPRHHHTPTSSSSSASTATTVASVSTVRTLPRIPSSDSQSQSTSSRHPPRGHTRASHHTSSSTSSTTTSTAGSTSSMTVFSSASSMTTAHDDSDDVLHKGDDPVPPTPRSNAVMSPKSFKFADPSPPMSQRLRKSPTSPALQYRTLTRGVSPSSSASSESLNSSAASFSHSHSTTPTPSSACPTSSLSSCGPSPTSPAMHPDRLSPVISRASGQYRRAPEAELSEQPLSSASMKGHISPSNSYRYSSATGASRLELRVSTTLEPREDRKDLDEDVLSEFGFYGPSSFRCKSVGHRQSTLSASSSSSQSLIPSGSPVVPPLRLSSRQHLRAVAAQSAPPGNSMLLPRAKSASNIRHEAQAALERPGLSSSHAPPPLPATRAAATSSVPYNSHETQGQGRPPPHARSQTLQHNQMRAMLDVNKMGSGVPTSVPRPGPGRLRSGSTSAVYNQTYPQRDVKAPIRPPPAPPLDMSSARFQPPAAARGSATSSPLTPASAVQYGYAL